MAGIPVKKIGDGSIVFFFATSEFDCRHSVREYRLWGVYLWKEAIEFQDDDDRDRLNGLSLFCVECGYPLHHRHRPNGGSLYLSGLKNDSNQRIQESRDTILNS